MDNKSLKYWRGFAFLMVALNIAVLLFVLLGTRQHTLPSPPPHEGGGPAGFIIEQLRFTQQQEVEFNRMKRWHRDSVDALQYEGRMLREAFFAGLKSDSASPDKENLAQQIAENQRQIELVTYDHFAEVRMLCTPEQKIIFDKIIGEVLERMAPPHHRHPGR